MGIMLTNIRIKNFRSLESVDLTLKATNILIGQNNTGKSNFLKAIDIALGSYRDVSENDIFIADDERIDKNKAATIDIMLKPVGNDNNTTQNFSDFWTSVFTTAWITTDDTNGDFVGIRTKIQNDVMREDYIINRYPISEWNNSIDDARIAKKTQFTSDMADSLNSFYMDAQRDIAEDMKNKKSYFAKTIASNGLPEEKVVELEVLLNNINKALIENIPSLRQTSDKIKAVGNTLGTTESNIEIEPLSRKLSDLHRGMDIIFQDNNSAKFSISQHGMGTRSWISFLTLAAYVEWHSENIKQDDEEAEKFVVLTMEEPEAHLHPQAQRHLYEQIREFQGQKIISTHSPSVLTQADLGDIIHFTKSDGKTQTVRFNKTSYNTEMLNKIRREVINTRGELLFSSAIVLCEGITEEQALPIYFTEYFGVNPMFCGINIIKVDGQNYKPFLNLIKDFDIRWFIFSDGEEKAIKTIKEVVKVISTKDIKDLPNVVILNNGENYETHLIASDYTEVMIDAINQFEQNDDFFTNYTRAYNGKLPEAITEGIKKCHILKNLCENKKAQYASCIAEKIVNLEGHSKRIPPKVKVLLKEIAKVMHLSPEEVYCND
jgi:putative ATP-dependent endonuclease of OLD family